MTTGCSITELSFGGERLLIEFALLVPESSQINFDGACSLDRKNNRRSLGVKSARQTWLATMMNNENSDRIFL
ncbi:MAG: hypothetical protein ACJAY2_003414 [Pseudomonadales bacterium]